MRPGFHLVGHQIVRILIAWRYSLIRFCVVFYLQVLNILLHAPRTTRSQYRPRRESYRICQSHSQSCSDPSKCILKIYSNKRSTFFTKIFVSILYCNNSINLTIKNYYQIIINRILQEKYKWFLYYNIYHNFKNRLVNMIKIYTSNYVILGE